MRQPAPQRHRGKGYYVAQVLASERVQAEIEAYAARKAGLQGRDRGLAEGRKYAADVCQGMMADWDKSKVRGLAWSLHKIFRAMFSGLEYKAEQLTRLQEIQGPIVLLPNHRSYLDYVLIPYLFFSHGVQLPCVSNETSLSNIFLLSGLLKSIGAFELDQGRFDKDELYRAIFQEYLKCLLADD